MRMETVDTGRKSVMSEADTDRDNGQRIKEKRKKKKDTAGGLDNKRYKSARADMTDIRNRRTKHGRVYHGAGFRHDQQPLHYF